MDINKIIIEIKKRYSYIGSNPIYVGMSGGVDSSVTAVLLKFAKFNVRGLYMLCWNDNTPECTTDLDLRDAESIALTYNIPFQVIDLRKEYIQKVIEMSRKSYEGGITPNPDITCNDVIKFGILYDKLKGALIEDFYLATGHYAIVRHQSGIGLFTLHAGFDDTKDQSYFLYRILNKYDRLNRIIFPIGEYPKTLIRDIAKKINLKVASKPDSQGICFIGNVSLDKFLDKKDENNRGEIINLSGDVIGAHKGCEYYTIGQRKKLDISTYCEKPMYVINKNIKTNTIVVGTKEDAYMTEFQVKNLILSEIDSKALKNKIRVRVRNLGKKISCEIFFSESDFKKNKINSLNIRLKYPEFGVAIGQHAVFYKNDRVVGGGVISKVNTSYKKHFSF